MVPRAQETPKLALVMVGLPARGKTYVARKIARYLSWLGYNTRNFNVGDYRRAIAGAKQPPSFFDPHAQEGRKARERIATLALDDMLAWLSGEGQVAIYDATNTERGRRDAIYKRCREADVQSVFVESICEDQSVVEANVRANKLRSPDYVGMDPEVAVADFRERIALYEKTYEPVGGSEKSYVKLIDVGRQVVVNRMEGYLSARLIFFLMNIHPAQRRIWLTRHGESRFNLEGRIGGDTELTPRGKAFAEKLTGFMNEQGPSADNLLVWTSRLRRSLETAEPLPYTTVAWQALDEINAGVCDSLTYEEIRRQMPDEFEARRIDKFRYRYPRGESYNDVISRLEPFIVELERQRRPVLVVSHQAVVRALYGYLMGKPQAECPHLYIPLHTVIQLTPTAYGYEERRIPLGPEVEQRSSS